MPIPTAFDRRLAEIDALFGSVMVTLKTLRYADPKRRDGRIVRERLQDLTDAVVEAANHLLADEV